MDVDDAPSPPLHPRLSHPVDPSVGGSVLVQGALGEGKPTSFSSPLSGPLSSFTSPSSLYPNRIPHSYRRRKPFDSHHSPTTLQNDLDASPSSNPEFRASTSINGHSLVSSDYNELHGFSEGALVSKRITFSERRRKKLAQRFKSLTSPSHRPEQHAEGSLQMEGVVENVEERDLDDESAVAHDKGSKESLTLETASSANNSGLHDDPALKKLPIFMKPAEMPMRTMRRRRRSQLEDEKQKREIQALEAKSARESEALASSAKLQQELVELSHMEERLKDILQRKVFSEDQLELVRSILREMDGILLHKRKEGGDRWNKIKRKVNEAMQVLRIKMVSCMTETTQTTFEALEDVRNMLITQILADEEAIQLELERMDVEIGNIAQPLHILFQMSQMANSYPNGPNVNPTPSATTEPDLHSSPADRAFSLDASSHLMSLQNPTHIASLINFAPSAQPDAHAAQTTPGNETQSSISSLVSAISPSSVPTGLSGPNNVSERDSTHLDKERLEVTQREINQQNATDLANLAVQLSKEATSHMVMVSPPPVATFEVDISSNKVENTPLNDNPDISAPSSDHIPASNSESSTSKIMHMDSPHEPREAMEAGLPEPTAISSQKPSIPIDSIPSDMPSIRQDDVEPKGASMDVDVRPTGPIESKTLPTALVSSESSQSLSLPSSNLPALQSSIKTTTEPANSMDIDHNREEVKNGTNDSHEVIPSHQTSVSSSNTSNQTSLVMNHPTSTATPQKIHFVISRGPRSPPLQSQLSSLTTTDKEDTTVNSSLETPNDPNLSSEQDTPSNQEVPAAPPPSLQSSSNSIQSNNSAASRNFLSLSTMATTSSPVHTMKLDSSSDSSSYPFLQTNPLPKSQSDELNLSTSSAPLPHETGGEKSTFGE